MKNALKFSGLFQQLVRVIERSEIKAPLIIIKHTLLKLDFFTVYGTYEKKQRKVSCD